MSGMNLTREEMDRLLAGGAKVRKPVTAPAAPDHTVFVEKMTTMVERMGELNMEQLERIEGLLREMRRPVPAPRPAAPAPAQPVVRRLTVNRNARGFIESVDVETE